MVALIVDLGSESSVLTLEVTVTMVPDLSEPPCPHLHH